MNIVELIDYDSIHKEKSKKNVCAYARVSTFKHLQETSFDLQIETYTKMIMNNPEWTFVGVFADEGKSGTNTKYRDQFNLMVDLSKSGNIDLIITKSVSRFARNTIDCLTVIHVLKSYGTEVWFEKENLSSFDPKIEFVISVMAGMAEEESRNISDNVKWGVQKRFKDGNFHMVTSQVLGYDRDDNNEVIINKSEAKIVKLIFNMYSLGSSTRKIAHHLNSLGHKTKVGNVEWYGGAVSGILNNEKYTGNAVLQKTHRLKVGSRIGERNQSKLPKYFVENSHPGIITQSLWDKVHDRKNKNILKYNHTLNKKELKKKATFRSEYSEFVQCSICGRNYHYKVNNRNQPWETKILICSSNRETKQCVNDSLFVETFDEIIIAQINQVLLNKSEFLNTLRKAFISHPEIIMLNVTLAQTQAKLDESDSKLRTLINSTDEFDIKVRNELIEIQSNTQIEYIKCKNQLMTTHNTENRLERYKSLLKNYNHPISKISDFPFKKLFDLIKVNNRNDIEFVIRFDDSNASSTYAFQETSTEYLIRKTKHLAQSIIKVY